MAHSVDTKKAGSFGSPPDQRHRHPESPHLGVQLTKTRESGGSYLNVSSWGLSGCFRVVARTAAYSQRQTTSAHPLTRPVGRHGRYVTFQLAEVAMPRALIAEILRLINRLRPAPSPP